jgi:L-2,4-diaminobutyric acid acetyltransferase
MLDALAGPNDVNHLETTIIPGDDTSMKLFTKFAERWHADVECRELFHERLLGDSHPREIRVRVSPLRSRRNR